MERESRHSHFMIPIFIFFVLLVVNGYFWNDYTSAKNKTVLLQKEKRSLLDTAEEQKTSLEEYTKNLTKLEKENSILTEEFASTTLKLQFVETEILKYETEISSVAEEMEMVRLGSPQVEKESFDSAHDRSFKNASTTL